MSRPRNSRARAARSASSTAGAVAKQDRSARRTNTTDLAPHDLRLLVQEQVRTEIKSWSGPLPPPEALEHFNRVVPGCAEKIVDAFVQQSAHRRSLESMVVSGSEARANRGQWLIYSLLLLVVVGGSVGCGLRPATSRGSSHAHSGGRPHPLVEENGVPTPGVAIEPDVARP